MPAETQWPPAPCLRPGPSPLTRPALLALVLFVLLFVGAAPARPASPPASQTRKPTPTRPSRATLAADAMRLLQENCLSCHDDEKPKGGLRLTSRKQVLQGGDSGPAAVPGKPDQSRVVRVLAADADPHMPPRKQLSTNQIALMRRWVQGGLSWDAAALTNRGPALRNVTLGDWPASLQPSLAVVFSPDGTRLALGRGRELVVHGLDTTNFPTLARLTPHRDAVRSLAWSADGRWLASGSFRELTVWNATDWTVHWSCTNGLAGRIAALQFTPDSGRLVAADNAPAQAGWVRIYDAASGRPTAAWPAHTDSANTLALSHDGKRLATAGADRLVKVWDLDTGRELTVLEGHTGGVLAVAFNHDASQLVSGGADKQLKVWDIQTKETIAILGSHKHALNAVTWSADDKTIVAVDDAGVAFAYTEVKRHTGEQSSASGNERQIASAGETLYTLSLSGDSQQIAAGGHTGTVHLWTLQGKLIHKSERPPLR